MSSMKWLAETSSVASILMCTGLTKLHPSTLDLHKPSFHVICYFPFHVILHYWGIISKSETLRGSFHVHFQSPYVLLYQPCISRTETTYSKALQYHP